MDSHIFGFKKAPTVFQNANEKIFHTLLSNAHVFINDTLLYSLDNSHHGYLLSQFYDSVKSHGIMLFQRKIVVGKTTIDFLGIMIVDGKYMLQPHIATTLLDFLDVLISQNQV